MNHQTTTISSEVSGETDSATTLVWAGLSLVVGSCNMVRGGIMSEVTVHPAEVVPSLIRGTHTAAAQRHDLCVLTREMG